MKSKTSFFNRGIAKNLLHRCWPLWAAYLILLLLLLPLMLRQQVQNAYGYVGLIPVLDDLTAGMGEEMMILSGTGEVIVPDDGIAAVGSGGNYALAAARALLSNTDLPAREIAEKALHIAADICVYTNHSVVVEET